MLKSMDIINELRKDFAELKGILIYFQNRRPYSVEQALAVNAAVSTFGFLQSWYLCNLRKQFGNQNAYRMEKIDRPPSKTDYSINTKALFDEIQEKAQNIQRKLLELPGEDGCDSIQSAEIDNLQEGLRWWRNVELPRMISVFGGN